MPTPLNTPSADLLSITSASAPSELGNAASAGVSKAPSASDHIHQVPPITGDVVKVAGVADSEVQKIRGKTITSNAPSVGSVLQWDGNQLVWGTPNPTTGGGGSSGITFFLNYETDPDNPITGLPILANSVTYKELGRSINSNATQVQSATLTNNGVYQNVCGFITDVLDPDSTTIPVGLWDFNIWASTNDSGSETSIRIKVYKYTGSNSTYTEIASSSDAVVLSTKTLLNLTANVPQQTIALTDRIAVVVQATSAANGHYVIINFGGDNPSHTHTTLPIVGGTGFVRVVNGGIQSQGSKVDLASDSDVTGILPFVKGGIGSGTLGTGILKSTGSAIATATAQDFPVLNQNTTGSAAKISGNAVSTTVPTDGYALVWSSTTTQWEPKLLSTLSSSDLVSYSVNTVSTSALTTVISSTATTLIFPVGVQSAIDGHTIALNDVILLTSQSAPSNNGPWKVTTVGSSGVSAVWVRPSWFTTGTAKSGTLLCVSNGVINQGAIYVVFSTTSADAGIVIGTSSISVALIGGKLALPISAGGTGVNNNSDARAVLGGLQTVTIRHSSTLALQTAAILSGATWTSGSAIMAFASSTATLAAGMSLNASGITAAVVKTVDGESVASFTSSFTAGSTLNVTAVSSGTIIPGMVITGGTVSGSVTISANGTGTGGVGTYTTSGTTQTIGTTATTGTCQKVTMSANATAGGGPSTITVYNSTVSTITSASIVSMDGRTMVVGDTIILSSQGANAQNGPWVLNSLAGGVMSFVRPSYWSGTIFGNKLFYIEQGTNNYGSVLSVSGAIQAGSTVGIDAFSAYTVIQRATNATVGANTYTGRQTFFAGGTGTNAYPFGFQAGVTMTTPQAHAVEWDNSSMYITNASAIRKRVSYIEESFLAATYSAIVNVDIDSQEIVTVTGATAPYVLNLRGSSTVTLNSILEIGKSRTISVISVNGATAYRPSLKIDDSYPNVIFANGVSSPNPNVTDIYSYTILKTANNTYTVYASVVKYL